MAYDQINATVNDGIRGFMLYPTSVDPYFYGYFLFAIWIVLTLGYFYLEKGKVGKGNIMSSLSVASVAIMILSFFGTLFGIVTNEILGFVLTMGFIILFIWYIKE